MSCLSRLDFSKSESGELFANEEAGPSACHCRENERLLRFVSAIKGKAHAIPAPQADEAPINHRFARRYNRLPDERPVQDTIRRRIRQLPAARKRSDTRNAIICIGEVDKPHTGQRTHGGRLPKVTRPLPDESFPVLDEFVTEIKPGGQHAH